jgi:uncharacterized Zn-finger protein
MLVHQNLERRFVCEICNAALKRKDHLTRHKQSHNPERPYLCHCLKAFKRKEQLSLHSVIHSGNKKHSCNECGKGFYRKDHLRKHTRSHIARRLKAGNFFKKIQGSNPKIKKKLFLELSQQPTANDQNNQNREQQQQSEAQSQQIMQMQNC